MRHSRPRRRLSLRHRDPNAVRHDPSGAQNAEKNGARKSGKKPGIRRQARRLRRHLRETPAARTICRRMKRRAGTH